MINNLNVLTELDALNALGGREDVVTGVYADVTNYDTQRLTSSRAIKCLAGAFNAIGQWCDIVASVECISGNDDRARIVWTIENTVTGAVLVMRSELNAKTTLTSINSGKAINVTGYASELELSDAQAVAVYLVECLPVAIECVSAGTDSTHRPASQPMQHAFGIVREVHEARFWNGGIMQGKAKSILG
jgi:hypothetical protein